MVFRMRAYTHGGWVGHTDSESAQPFRLGKNSVFRVLLTGFEPSTFGSPALVQISLCLTTLRVCTARTQMCAHVKDPISIYRTRVGLTASGMNSRKHCTQHRKWVALYYGCSLFPGKEAQMYRALDWETDNWFVTPSQPRRSYQG